MLLLSITASRSPSTAVSFLPPKSWLKKALVAVLGVFKTKSFRAASNLSSEIPDLVNAKSTSAYKFSEAINCAIGFFASSSKRLLTIFWNLSIVFFIRKKLFFSCLSPN